MEKYTYSDFYSVKDFIVYLRSKIRPIFAYPLRQLRKYMKKGVWSITELHGNNTSLKILFIGEYTDQIYFSNLFFKNNADVVHIGELWLWKAFYYLLRFRHHYDLLICFDKIKYWNIFVSEKNFLIPNWVSCEIELRPDESHGMLSKQIKKNIRKIKKHGYTYSISKELSDFNFFYNEMYRPYVSVRHKRTLAKISYETMRENFDNGELLLIKNEDKIVSGGILNYTIMRGVPRGTQLGVYKGDFNYVKNGALIAYYYYAIEYLKKKKHEKFSLGASRPFLSDGVLKHKLSWDAKIICESPNGFLFRFLSKKKSLHDFFSNNPFICIYKKKLCVTTFTDSGSFNRKKRAAYINKIKSYGIDQFNLVQLS